MTSKQRAYLKSLAMKMDAIIQLGKGGLTPVSNVPHLVLPYRITSCLGRI